MQGFELTKQHGQHLLANPLVIKSIVEKAEIRSTDTVLEIGPGTGNLTLALLEKAKHVIAIEIDPRMVSELKKRIAAIPEYRGKFTIIHKDFTKMLATEIPTFDLCVSNCPYNISSGIVFRLLEIQPLPRKFVLMFQLEFAQRLAAEPGQDQYSRLTVNTKLLSKTKIIIRVSRNSFKPPPNVDSAVVEMYPIGPPPGLDLDEFNGLTRILFSKKNKTLGAIFKTKSLLDDLANNMVRLEEISRLHKPCQSSNQEASGVVHAPSSGNSVTTVLTGTQIRERIAEALAEANLADMRPNHMAIPDLLSLMCALTAKGVRFTN